MKPYYDHGGVQIFHGDCREVLPSLSADFADVVLTDPPYNVGKKYGTAGDDMEAADYVAWLSSILGECGRVSKDSVCYFPGTANVWGIADLLQGCGLRPHRMLAWHKKEYAGDKFNAGPAMCWEPVVWATKREKPWYNRKRFGQWGRDCLVVDATHGDPWKKHHPCPKPLKVMRWLARLFCPPGGLIVDPFMGTGTTLLAAKEDGFRAIGIEVEERYCEVAVRRLSQEVISFGETCGA